MRNSAAQMSQSGARGRARTVEDAYKLRAEATAKRLEEQGLETLRRVRRPELLPELVALEDCFAGEASWAEELAGGVRSQIVKAVRAAAEREAAEDNWRRAAALRRRRARVRRRA